jgi:hypothetical protein
MVTNLKSFETIKKTIMSLKGPTILIIIQKDILFHTLLTFLETFGLQLEN